MPAPRARRRALLPLAGLLVILALVALYAARKVIAREALTGWLRAQGVAARSQVAGVGPGGFTGRLEIGDPRAPDFVAGDATVRWGFRGLTFEIREVTLRRPILRARLHDGVISAGALDPLIEEFRSRPPQPDRGQPRVELDDALLLLTTDYGPVRLTADVVVQEGKLISLAATSGPTRLKGPAFDAAIGAATLGMRTRRDEVEVALDAPIARLAAGGLTAETTRLQIKGVAPYPDLKARQAKGQFSLAATISGDHLSLADKGLDGATIKATAVGQMSGWLDTLAVTGRGGIDFTAASGHAGAAGSGGIRLAVAADDLRWTRGGGDVVAATPQGSVLVQDMVAGDLKAPQIRATFRGPMRYGPAGLDATLNASLSGRVGWSGLGAVTPVDAGQMAAIKRAVRSAQLSAPALSLGVRPGAMTLALIRPVTLRPTSGGTLTISPRGAAPVLSPRGGAFSVAVRGGGLPTLTAEVPRLTIMEGAVVAQAGVKAAFSIGPIQDGAVEASGVLRIADRSLSFAADRCAPLTARRIDFGANTLEAVALRLCPWSGPMLIAQGGGWRFRAKAAGADATAPFLQAKVVEGAGRITAAQVAGRLSVNAVLDQARILDAAPQPRFNPLQAAGVASMARDRWTGDFIISTAAARRVAQVILRHDTRSGAGGIGIDTGVLSFAEGGLQPSQLSPLAGAIGSPAQGTAQFAGRFDWTTTGATSAGVLTLPGLDFVSPAGRVTGLKGVIAFTSLAPLIAAPDQTLSAEAIAAIVPITGVTAGVAVDAQALTITGGEASVGGGKVRVESLRLPLAPAAAMAGVLDFDGVQLHDLVEASPFGDRVELDVRVSGRVPFESQAGKVRITGAELHAIQPGRLSISRQALTGVAASGAVEAPATGTTPVAPTDTFTDFAYQAMENLAFDTLNAAIASREDGRLGVLAHIVGRHDPPQRQAIKLSLSELIGRKFLNRPLPLPSNTAVNLTLDTTLNLDDLLNDYADYQRLRGSPAVQP